MLRPATPTVTVERIGEEAEPVIVLDDFTGRISDLEAAGRAATYRPVPGYPGQRSPVSPRYFGNRGQLLVDLLREHFGYAGGAKTESCAFSIVTTPPAHLSPGQTIPHYDGAEPTLMALLHFTGGACSGGTAFYRHRRTGFETLRPEREADYRKAVAQDDAQYGAPGRGYYHGDGDRYDMIAEFEARPDRALLYRGRLLHSGVIPNPPGAEATPATARLTINTFLHARA